MPNPMLTEPVSMQVRDARYRLCETGHVGEPDIEAGWERVALALSAVETLHRDDWCKRFKTILSGFRFLPGGRGLAGAGTPWRRTLFDCIVSGTLHDSVGGIFSALSEAMLTMQAGGGIGCDFSPLRPAGFVVDGTGGSASGPVWFLRIWNEACSVLTSRSP